jgi:hypothetical protein
MLYYVCSWGEFFNWKSIMSTHLERIDLINCQQMEVAVNGPDGATYLILCTGVADLGSVSHDTYTFLVGPQISRRQFVGVIASGALSRIQAYDKNPAGDLANLELAATLISIEADYDDEASQVKVKADVSSSKVMRKLAISYNVNILAELPFF